jgi:hypothetical protein
MRQAQENGSGQEKCLEKHLHGLSLWSFVQIIECGKNASCSVGGRVTIFFHDFFPG